MATDSFTNTDGTTLESHDSSWNGDTTDAIIVSNAVRANSNYRTCYCAYVGSGTDYSKVTWKAQTTANNNKGPMIRNPGDGGSDGYIAKFVSESGGNWTGLSVYHSGGSFVGSAGSGTWAVGSDHTVAISASDNGTGVDITVWVDDVEIGTVNQATRSYETDLSGFSLNSNGSAADSALDDWADTADTASIIPQVTHHYRANSR